jgi:hypothetical protein
MLSRLRYSAASDLVQYLLILPHSLLPIFYVSAQTTCASSPVNKLSLLFMSCLSHWPVFAGKSFAVALWD